jgi:hypothetical protein
MSTAAAGSGWCAASSWQDDTCPPRHGRTVSRCKHARAPGHAAADVSAASLPSPPAKSSSAAASMSSVTAAAGFALVRSPSPPPGRFYGVLRATRVRSSSASTTLRESRRPSQLCRRRRRRRRRRCCCTLCPSRLCGGPPPPAAGGSNSFTPSSEASTPPPPPFPFIFAISLVPSRWLLMHAAGGCVGPARCVRSQGGRGPQRTSSSFRSNQPDVQCSSSPL